MRRPESMWNVLLIVSLGVLFAALGFGFLIPPADRTADPSELTRIEALAVKAGQRADADDKAVAAKTWPLDQQTLASTVLDRLTTLAQKHKVQLSSFRTDKPVPVAGLNQSPYVAVVEGAFPDVLAFAERIEDPNSRLAEQMLQITASDSAPGQVVATIGLVAYTKPAKEAN